ncbi:MAG: prepilin-type N-terminal cleavage/methylation domain-containing protein [Deltaproteobacteria bacterium]|nr:prepilin-type N-terminal cleavage/methylation domain-containing protein [Deltaproteobacteria bacterium]MCW5801967.1 prepilin-type N-terminal cleavage/methylation domain-containing protein [Deltaproteobacteria bacterium]
MRRQGQRDQRGFTVVELIIVVAVVAILAAIAVPAFMRTTNKTKGQAELSIMITELREKEERYKQDNGVYLSASACPATPSFATQDASSCIAGGTPWAQMKVNLAKKMLSCSYEIVTGLKGVAPTPPAPFTMATPAVSWYYLLATCDFDANAAQSRYFTSSVDSTLQSDKDGD